MSTTWKIVIGAGAAVLMLSIVGFSVHQSNKNLVTVQTSKVQRMDLATVVSASGEIKPKTFVNIGANAFGKITKLYVKEGDRVKKGQLLAQLESVQSGADVNATQASLDAAQSDAIAAEAALRTDLAGLEPGKVGRRTHPAGLGPKSGIVEERSDSKSEYDTQKALWQTAQAGLAQAEARVAQAKAQKESADRHITQNQANLMRVSDVLQKTGTWPPSTA